MKRNFNITTMAVVILTPFLLLSGCGGKKNNASNVSDNDDSGNASGVETVHEGTEEDAGK